MKCGQVPRLCDLMMVCRTAAGGVHLWNMEMASWAICAYPCAFKIYGEKGTLCASVMQYDFIPDGNGQKIHRDVVLEKEKYPADVTQPNIEIHTAPATRGHMLNFLDAIDRNIKPVADIEKGHISTASCIMANMSMKLGRPLCYDPVKKEIIGDAEATKLLQRPYRGPWQHP